MTHEEAQRECERLASEHPERETHGWFPREYGKDEWSVVRVPVPEGLRLHPLKASVEARPRPPQADDPRPSSWQNVPPYAAGGA
jgi:hypothetical protein